MGFGVYVLESFLEVPAAAAAHAQALHAREALKPARGVRRQGGG